MILKYIALFLCYLLTLAFLNPVQIFATTYYFQDEFNEERSPNTLNSSKWTVYNNAPVNITTIQESGGSLQMLQLANTAQFPLVVSQNALPDGDFFAEIKFQFTKITFWGTGIALSEQAPTNGGGFDKVLTVNVWQDKSVGPNMRISFGNDISLLSSIVYTAPVNTNQHMLSIERKLNNYLIYLDSQLIYTSPPTTHQLKYIWMGNPSIQNPPIPDWSTFKVDYVRVTGAPEPFLDLPWDYKTKGLSFNEAAMSINSFFDHQYPLLSRGFDLSEPVSASTNIVDYLGRTTDSDYTKHDGYDWGNRAKARLGDPVLAAASGSATYINSCSSCGNMAVIDHGNGYQTRYMHLLDDGLITNTPNQPTPVSDRQQIGKVGFSGDIRPKNERGAHIHFGVFQDKNGDGNFTDNEPDGVTDPFGWQSTSADPWENYTFNYLGQGRTGNFSFYLWKNKLYSTSSTVTTNGASLTTGNYTLTFPQNSTNQDITVNAQSTPVMQPSNNLISAGSSLLIRATDSSGNSITQLSNPFTISLDFRSLDLSKLNISTLSFYSSPDGTNWIKENTSFPTTTQAQTQTNHFSFFALAGERKDTTAPTTKALLSGTKGQSFWFRSDVQLTLNARDNEEGSGVYYTLYRINNGETQVYNQPVNFTKEGRYKVDFYSADQDDNIEETKVVEFHIDKTPPEARIYPNGTNMDISVTGQDNNQTTVTIPNRGKYNRIYQITDQAGNTLDLDVRELNPVKIDRFKIYSLKYNKGDTINLPNNMYSIEYGANSKELIRLLHKFTMKENNIYIRYDKKTKKSEIFIVEAGKEKPKQTREGMITLSLITSNGNLKYQY